MSSVNYSLNNKGVRLIPSEDAWVIGKNGRAKLNPNYTFIGKIDSRLSNIIIKANDRGLPTYKGNTYDLNNVAKNQIVNHFFNSNGKRNNRTVAYFGIYKNKDGK